MKLLDTHQDSSSITGISSETDYFVRKIDDDNFYLYSLGTGSLDRRYYIDNNIPVNITKEGTGYFNYKPITVTVSGLTVELILLLVKKLIVQFNQFSEEVLQVQMYQVKVLVMVLLKF